MKRDIVILFGAGASYGAGHVLPQAPPLGIGLYDALAARYPKDWGPDSHLGKMWAPQLREDFERTMFDEVLPRVPSLSLLEWHRRVAEFFASYKLDGSSCDCYSLLLFELRASGLVGRLMLGSLNYDCLLEQAMLGLQLAPDYMLNDVVAQVSIPLAKIHGSCNFITADLFRWRPYLTNANASSIECGFTAFSVGNLEDSLRDRFSTHEPAFFPVLSVYSPEKPSMVAPAKLQRLRNVLAEKISHATALVLIGLKPNPRDSPLLDPIAQSPASRIGYVGGTADYESLRAVQRKAVHLAPTFEDGFAEVT